MRKAYLFMAATFLAAIAASAASAQTAPNRQGFYADLGVNYTVPTITATNGISTEKESGGGVGYSLGLGIGLKNNKTRIGLEVDYFKVSDVFGASGLSNTVIDYTAVGTFYPSANNLWLRLNLGYGTAELSGSGNSSSAGGFVWGLGIGYDMMLGKGGVALVPFISYLNLNRTDDFGGALAGQNVYAKVAMWQFGVSLGLKH